MLLNKERVVLSEGLIKSIAYFHPNKTVPRPLLSKCFVFFFTKKGPLSQQPKLLEVGWAFSGACALSEKVLKRFAPVKGSHKALL